MRCAVRYTAGNNIMKHYSVMLVMILSVSGSAAAESPTYKESAFRGVNEYTGRLEYACDSIAEILRTVERLQVIQAEGFVEDDKTARKSIGCMAFAASDIILNESGEFPHDILRKGLEAGRWREDLSRAGDGPGSTTFSLYRHETMCTISAMWGASVRDDTRNAPNTIYELEAECMNMPADRSRKP